jgi:cytochrome c oxidase cbb3-type subunit 1
MVAAGALYHLLMRLWNTEMYSARLVNLHFWMATVGAVIYIIAMWVSGIMQGLMWRDYDEFGTLTYTFAESVAAMHPYYAMRAVGGLIFWGGAVVMLYNAIMTIRQASGARDASPAVSAA